MKMSLMRPSRSTVSSMDIDDADSRTMPRMRIVVPVHYASNPLATFGERGVVVTTDEQVAQHIQD
ncbi:MAG: hypothetical protein HOI47_17565 [Candidatus Scalindua sp.]|jgi:hypothetical protein|nr:hypothetical protein [Candidatus Scalindua sp.]